MTGSSCEAILSTTLVFVISVSCRTLLKCDCTSASNARDIYSDPIFALEKEQMRAASSFVDTCIPTPEGCCLVTGSLETCQLGTAGHVEIAYSYQHHVEIGIHGI